ncbi:MAG: hypothetical protein KAT46_05140 [Deltaproteobacteria bacterium]|nr:hypothetical protein [Deltaproteobacteria bacterium]
MAFMKRYFLGVALFVSLIGGLFLSSASSAATMTDGTYTLTPDVFASGGGDSSATGGSSLSGTIGQPVAGYTVGGTNTLLTGFWNSTVLGFEAPYGTIVLKDGDVYTNLVDINALIDPVSDAINTAQVSQVILSTDGVFDTESWETIGATQPVTLDTGDGGKVVYARLMDTDGYVSNTITDDIVLDQTGPSDGSLSATGQNTVVELVMDGFSDVTSGVENYSIVFDANTPPVDCQSGTLIYTGSDLTYLHSGLANGAATGYYRVCANDFAGNTSLGATGSAVASGPGVDGISVAFNNTGGNPGIGDNLEGVSRASEENDLDNYLLEATSTLVPAVDAEYTFEFVLTDASGSPLLIQLHLTQRVGSTSVGDYATYTLDPSVDCTGDFVSGASCSFTTRLGPSNGHAFYFTATLGDLSGTVITYPVTALAGGALPGPVVSLLNGYNMVGIPRVTSDLTDFDGSSAFNEPHTYRWVSSALSTVDGNNGAYEQVDLTAAIIPVNFITESEGYYLWNNPASTPNSLPLALNDNPDVATATHNTADLLPGWNIISNPYSDNIELSSVLVSKNGEPAVTWESATTNGWIVNGIYYYDGSDWGSTYSFEAAGSTPEATITPWLGYWVYLKNDDSNTYQLVMTKPVTP